MSAPISISWAAYLLTQLRLRRMLNQLRSLWRYRMGSPDRKASPRASPVRAIFGILIALFMLHGFTVLAYQSIANIENSFRAGRVENAAHSDQDVGGRANAPGRERSELSLHRASPAPGSVLAARVLYGVSLVATLILAAVLFGAIASRELVRPEWDLEWLITLPLPLSTLICSMLIERVVTNSLGFVLLGTFLSALAWKCGHGLAAPLLGIGLTILILFLVATVQVLVDTGLRLILQPPRLRDLQALMVVLAMLPFLFVVYLALPGYVFLLDWVPIPPHWVMWLPSGLAVEAIASNDVGSALRWSAIMAAEILVVVAIGALLLRHQLRNGVIAAGPREAAARRARPADAALSDFLPGVRTLLSAVQRRELLHVWRNRTLVVQAFLVPAMMVGLQLLLAPSGNLASRNAVLVSALQPTSTLAIIAFSSVLTVMPAAFQTLGAEGAGLWILYSVPHSLESILLQKAKLWAALALIYPVVIFTTSFATAPAIPLQFIASAVVVLLGVPMFSVIAVALSVFACDPLAQEVRRRVRVTYVYLYLMLGSFYAYAIYADSIWQRIALMIMTALVAMALWQKARDQFDYLLDPSASPPSRVSLSDGLIAALAFFVLQALAVVVLTMGGRPASGQAILIAFCIAGALTYGVMRLIYWRARTAGVPVIVGGDVLQALRWGLAGGVVASICGIAYLEFVGSMGLVPVLPAIPVADPALPAWLAALAIGAAPVFEEFIFRGLIFGGLRRSLGPPAATLASAAVFAIVHPPAAVIPVFVMGVCAALIYERTRALVAPMLVHAIYNATVIGFQWNAMH